MPSTILDQETVLTEFIVLVRLLCVWITCIRPIRNNYEISMHYYVNLSMQLCQLTTNN